MKVMMSYDMDADVLYVSLGKPVKAIGRELENGVIERVDPNSKKVVGFTIVGFSKKRDRSPHKNSSLKIVIRQQISYGVGIN